MTTTFWRDRRQYRHTWHGTGRRSYAHVESEHPDCGWLTRGTIRSTGIADTTGPGLAGHLVWRLSDYDSNELDPVTGDYVDAEKALLEATTELEK